MNRKQTIGHVYTHTYKAEKLDRQYKAQCRNHGAKKTDSNILERDFYRLFEREHHQPFDSIGSSTLFSGGIPVFHDLNHLFPYTRSLQAQLNSTAVDAPFQSKSERHRSHRFDSYSIPPSWYPRTFAIIGFPVPWPVPQGSWSRKGSHL